MHMNGDAIHWYQEWTKPQKLPMPQRMRQPLSLRVNVCPLTYPWDEFQKDLKTRSLPPHYLDYLANEFHALEHNNAPILSYANKVMQLGV